MGGPHDALPSVYELPLFRIIQDGLNNIGQHAHASSVQVRLDLDAAGRVAASVRDNGSGFDPRRMRERILDLDGTLDIRNAVGHGTELVITLPPVSKEVNHTRNSGAFHAID